MSRVRVLALLGATTVFTVAACVIGPKQDDPVGTGGEGGPDAGFTVGDTDVRGDTSLSGQDAPSVGDASPQPDGGGAVADTAGDTVGDTVGDTEGDAVADTAGDATGDVDAGDGSSKDGSSEDGSSESDATTDAADALAD